MTHFMARVSELLEPGSDVVRPETHVSVRVPVPIGVHYHVEYRSLAEQLVCEANAVLSPTGQRLELTDDLREGELSFYISYRDRRARVSTTIIGSAASAHLRGVGACHRADVELTGPEQIERLILLLISGDRPVAAGYVGEPGVPSP
jgi:hypothetical protein